VVAVAKAARVAVDDHRAKGLQKAVRQKVVPVMNVPAKGDLETVAHVTKAPVDRMVVKGVALAVEVPADSVEVHVAEGVVGWNSIRSSD
jgi:hypothetical protein